jgi:hypothetical protein
MAVMLLGNVDKGMGCQQAGHPLAICTSPTVVKLHDTALSAGC